jgi:hypothetical protein
LAAYISKSLAGKRQGRYIIQLAQAFAAGETRITQLRAVEIRIGEHVVELLPVAFPVESKLLGWVPGFHLGVIHGLDRFPL